MSRSSLKTFIVLFFLSILTYRTSARTSDILKVKLDHGGVLVGRHLTSLHGRHIRAFLGVPYAQPPVGDLRFKTPVPYGSWEGERLATQDSSVCSQIEYFFGSTQVSGSEDCLYLNVYTPEEQDTKKALPVMVWFHGGAFTWGTGSSQLYSPKYIMDKDVIFVAINYRLGPLGFLSTETLDCPGNNGLKDQTAALEWVQKNIAAFGGDRNSVTIFGESAGGSSVGYHMISQRSQELFHKGIAQSGSVYNPWAQPFYKGVSSQKTRKLAKIVGCDVSSDKWSKILECLRTKPAEDITAAFLQFFDWEINPITPFGPVVEPEHEGAFLTAFPRNNEPSYYNSKPLIIGFTSEEGLFKSCWVVNQPHILEDFKNRFDKVLPIVMNYNHLTQKRQTGITKSLVDFYFNDGLSFDKHNFKNFTNMFTDGWFIYGVDEHIRHRLSFKNSASTYVYVFDHKGSSSATEILHGGENYYGTSHFDDVLSLYPIGEAISPTASRTKRDREVTDTMLDLWVNFASTSDPTPIGTKLPKWTAATDYPPKFLRISSKDDQDPLLRFSEDYPLERINFWHAIKPFLPVQNSEHQEL